jgi:hypothetical protein
MLIGWSPLWESAYHVETPSAGFGKPSICCNRAVPDRRQWPPPWNRTWRGTAAECPEAGSGLRLRFLGARGWSQSTITRVLSSTTYKGEAWHDRHRPVDSTHPRTAAGPTSLEAGNRASHALRPTEEWISVLVPAIIDQDTWRLAQKQLAHNRQRARRNNTRHAYLLSTLLTCSHCGRRITGAADGGDQRRHVCSARCPRHACGACDGCSVTAAQVEAQVWRWTAKLPSEPSCLPSFRLGDGEGRGFRAGSGWLA